MPGPVSTSGIPTSEMCVRCGGQISYLPPVVHCNRCLVDLGRGEPKGVGLIDPDGDDWMATQR